MLDDKKLFYTLENIILYILLLVYQMVYRNIINKLNLELIIS